MIHSPDHPRAKRATNRYVAEHVLVAERALGDYLRSGAEVHHVDENKSNNDPSNLVVCHDRGYHALLHRRLRALKACGNPNALVCEVCGGYDRQNELVIYGGAAKKAHHRDCAAAKARENHRARRARSA